MGKKVTFADIARKTGFSKTTVSRYFNSPEYLTEENRRIIADALEELDYKENKVARILANGKTEVIGIILTKLNDQFFSEVLHEILSTYEKYGYKFLVFTGNRDKEKEKRYLSELAAYNVEGLIVLSTTVPSEELLEYNIPVVAIEREDAHISSVTCDNYLGGVLATTLLLQSNCEVLVHINNDIGPSVPGYGRIRGFLDMAGESGLPYEFYTNRIGSTREENEALVMQVINELNRKYPDKKKGIFMSNDTNAGIMVNILVQRYGRLPADYRVVGFDDIAMAKEAVIPISTVKQQIDVMVNAAMEILNLQIGEFKETGDLKKVKQIHRVIPPILIRRRTTD